MDESKYENALQIILHAGNAKSAALMPMMAISKRPISSSPRRSPR